MREKVVDTSDVLNYTKKMQCYSIIIYMLANTTKSTNGWAREIANRV